MNYQRILTIQDISCVGQCSLTVALPILSACGLETAVLPSAVLSTHTAGFSGFTVRDLASDMPAISKHWQKEGIFFDGIYTGYLGSTEQVDYVLEIFEHTLKAGGTTYVDPAMADNGKLYPAFDDAYVSAMKRLCAKADFVIPNITEACFLTDTEYRTEYDRAYINTLLSGLTALGCQNIVLTGVSYQAGKTGVVVSENGNYQYYEHPFLPNSCHGTGDIYASAFVGSYQKGFSSFEAAKIAADYTLECIAITAELPDHWYGAAFEPAIPKLIGMISKEN